MLYFEFGPLMANKQLHTLGDIPPSLNQVAAVTEIFDKAPHKTMNQVAADIEDKLSFDVLTHLNNAFQKLMFRLYLDIVEMLYRSISHLGLFLMLLKNRFSHIMEGILAQLAEYSTTTNSPKDLEKLNNKIMGFVRDLRAPKLLRLQDLNPPPDLQRHHSENLQNATSYIGTWGKFDTASNFSAESRDDLSYFAPSSAGNMNYSASLRKLFLEQFEGCETQSSHFEDMIKMVCADSVIN